MIIIMSDAGDNKIKVSARTVRQGRSVREILERVMSDIGGEFGGHKYAAGCLMDNSKEQEFIERIKKDLEIELVKI